jgi:hypothetical protein
MIDLSPAIVTDSFTLFGGAPQDVLTALPTRVAAMALTIAPSHGTDVAQFGTLAAQLLRVTAGPVVVLTPLHAHEWVAALGPNAGIRTTYFDTLDVVAVNDENLDIPTDPDTLCDALQGMVEQESGTLIDIYASSWIVALPTILCGLRYVGVASGTAARATPWTIARTIQRKLDGCDRLQRHREHPRSGNSFRLGRKA